MTRIVATVFSLMILMGHAVPAEAQELYGTLKKISDSGEVVIGYREASPPFSFVNSGGRPQGYSIDLCLYVIEKVKTTLGQPDLAVRYVPVTSATRIPRIVDGTIDIECGSTSHTLDRREEVNFSFLIFLTGTQLLVKKDSGIYDYNDMKDKTVAVTRGTTNATRIREVVELLGIPMEVIEVNDHDEGFQAVKSGESQAYATDGILLHGLIQEAERSDEYTVVGNLISYDPYALMMRRDDSAFRLVVDRTLADLFYNRELLKIYDKWFGPLGVPMSEQLKTSMAIQMHVR